MALISEQADSMGAAIYDYHKYGKADVLRVFSSQFEEDEIPVSDLFRDLEDMPEMPLEDGSWADSRCRRRKRLP